MAESLYSVVLEGVVLDGFDAQETQERLAKLFKIQHDAAGRMLSGNIMTVKKGVDKPTAKKYLQALEAAGAKCHIEETAFDLPNESNTASTITAKDDSHNFDSHHKNATTTIASPQEASTAKEPIASAGFSEINQAETTSLHDDIVGSRSSIGNINYAKDKLNRAVELLDRKDISGESILDIARIVQQQFKWRNIKGEVFAYKTFNNVLTPANVMPIPWIFLGFIGLFVPMYIVITLCKIKLSLFTIDALVDVLIYLFLPISIPMLLIQVSLVREINIAVIWKVLVVGIGIGALSGAVLYNEILYGYTFIFGYLVYGAVIPLFAFLVQYSPSSRYSYLSVGGALGAGFVSAKYLTLIILGYPGSITDLSTNDPLIIITSIALWIIATYAYFDARKYLSGWVETMFSGKMWKTMVAAVAGQYALDHAIFHSPLWRYPVFCMIWYFIYRLWCLARVEISQDMPPNRID